MALLSQEKYCPACGKHFRKTGKTACTRCGTHLVVVQKDTTATGKHPTNFLYQRPIDRYVWDNGSIRLLGDTEVPSGNPKQPVKPIEGKTRRWVLRQRKALAQNTVQPVRQAKHITKQGVYEGYGDVKLGIGENVKAYIKNPLKRIKKKGKKRAAVQEDSYLQEQQEKRFTDDTSRQSKKETTYDWRTSRVERKRIQAEQKEAEQEEQARAYQQAKQEQKKEKKKRRTKLLGLAAGLAEPITKTATTAAKEGYAGAKETYQSATAQQARKKYSPLHKLRQKTTMKITNKLRKKGKDVVEKTTTKKVENPRTNRMENIPRRTKISGTNDYVAGKRQANRIKRGIKKQAAHIGKGLLGKKRYEKYENVAKQKKKRLKKQWNFAKKHPYKAMTVGSSKMAYKAQKKGLKGLGQANKFAAKKMGGAAKKLMQKDGLFALFKPMYWSLLLQSKLMMYPKPFLITGLFFGSMIAIWYFGGFSGYYALFAIKALVATILNTTFSIGNAIIFAMMGLLELIKIGVVAVINQVFYFFIGGLIEAVNEIAKRAPFIDPLNMDFSGISTEWNVDPAFGLSYVVPEPMNFSSVSAGIGSFFVGFSFISPNAEPYEIDHMTDAYMVEPVYVGANGETLFYPKINDFAKEEGIIANLSKDRPPPREYNFTTNPASIRINEDGTTTYIKRMEISITLFDGAIQAITGDAATVEEWLSNGKTYPIKDSRWSPGLLPTEWLRYENTWGISNCPEAKRDEYFFVAAMHSWDEEIVESGEAKNWLRNGIIKGTDGKMHYISIAKEEAKQYVIDNCLSFYTVDELNTIQEKSDAFITFAQNVLYPTYREYIKTEVEPWWP